jgi:hypothetical protein
VEEDTEVDSVDVISELEAQVDCASDEEEEAIAPWVEELLYPKGVEIDADAEADSVKETSELDAQLDCTSEEEATAP